MAGFFILKVCVNTQARGIKGLQPASASKFNLKKRHVKQLVRIIANIHQPLILLSP